MKWLSSQRFEASEFEILSNRAFIKNALESAKWTRKSIVNEHCFYTINGYLFYQLQLIVKTTMFMKKSRSATDHPFLHFESQEMVLSAVYVAAITISIIDYLLM